MPANMKLYYKAIEIKAVWYWHKNRHIPMEQSREPRNKPTSALSIILDRGSKHTKWVKDSLFNKWRWENWIDTYRRNETRLPSYTTHKNKFKMDQRLKC